MGNILLPMLEVDPNLKLSFGEAALYGLQMLLIGMLIVFAVLTLLWFAIALFGRIVGAGSTAAKPVTEKKPEPSVAPAASTDDTELIAVLTAAIAAMESAPATRFRVVSFRRK